MPNNQLKVIGSQKISQLKKLESFDISQNALSGAIPKWLGQLTLSDYIQISDNPALTGPIPAELCNIKGLRRIIIFNTGVSALLPGIGNCATLTELVVFDNKIAGGLPAELGKLKKLQRIAVSGNVMSGTLPASIGDLPNLTEFDIANNKFTGSIPSNYGPFVEQDLSTDFSGNQLSGVWFYLLISWFIDLLLYWFGLGSRQIIETSLSKLFLKNIQGHNDPKNESEELSSVHHPQA